MRARPRRRRSRGTSKLAAAFWPLLESCLEYGPCVEDAPFVDDAALAALGRREGDPRRPVALERVVEDGSVAHLRVARALRSAQTGRTGVALHQPRRRRTGRWSLDVERRTGVDAAAAV